MIPNSYRYCRFLYHTLTPPPHPYTISHTLSASTVAWRWWTCLHLEKALLTTTQEWWCVARASWLRSHTLPCSALLHNWMHLLLPPTLRRSLTSISRFVSFMLALVNSLHRPNQSCSVWPWKATSDPLRVPIFWVCALHVRNSLLQGYSLMYLTMTMRRAKRGMSLGDGDCTVPGGLDGDWTVSDGLDGDWTVSCGLDGDWTVPGGLDGDWTVPD